MKKRCFLYILIFGLFAFQNSTQVKSSNSIVAKKDTIILSLPDKLLLQTINENSKEFDWGKNMPWIGAILIGLTTVLTNILISRATRRSSLEIAKQQIELTKFNSERDFRKSVLSVNRHTWITEFRTIISELISLTIVLSTEQKFNSEDHYRLSLLVTKAELLLTNEPNHLVLSNILIELKICFTDILKGNQTLEDLENAIQKIKNQTLIIINKEWEKASNAE